MNGITLDEARAQFSTPPAKPKSIKKYAPEVCFGCGNIIDPEMCHCGEFMKDHDMIGGGCGYGTPIGCSCGYEKNP